MKYHVVFSRGFKKTVDKLDNTTYLLLKKWINKHLINCEDPRIYGKALEGNLKGFWRYRIGNNRLIAKIEDNEIVVLLIEFGQRSNIYK